MNKKLLEILACPSCKAQLVYSEKRQQLICRFERLGFPVRDGIPVMLLEEAEQLTQDEVEHGI